MAHIDPVEYNDLENAISAVRHAVYGSEVRNAIGDGLAMMNNRIDSDDSTRLAEKLYAGRDSAHHDIQLITYWTWNYAGASATPCGHLILGTFPENSYTTCTWGADARTGQTVSQEDQIYELFLGNNMFSDCPQDLVQGIIDMTKSGTEAILQPNLGLRLERRTWYPNNYKSYTPPTFKTAGIYTFITYPTPAYARHFECRRMLNINTREYANVWTDLSGGGGGGEPVDAYTKAESDAKFVTNTAIAAGRNITGRELLVPIYYPKKDNTTEAFNIVSDLPYDSVTYQSWGNIRTLFQNGVFSDYPQEVLPLSSLTVNDTFVIEKRNISPRVSSDYPGTGIYIFRSYPRNGTVDGRLYFECFRYPNNWANPVTINNKWFVHGNLGYYTSSQVDTLLDAKANASNVYTKTEVNTALNGKASTSNVYTKTEMDTALAAKYTTPQGGIPYEDLSDDLQTTINRRFGFYWELFSSQTHISRDVIIRLSEAMGDTQGIIPCVIFDNRYLCEFVSSYWSGDSCIITLKTRTTGAINESNILSGLLVTLNSSTETMTVTPYSAASQAIADAGGYFTSDTIEGALQELGAELNGLDAALGGLL